MHPTDAHAGLSLHLSAPDSAGLCQLLEALKDAVGGTQRIVLRGCSERPGRIDVTVLLAPADRKRMH